MRPAAQIAVPLEPAGLAPARPFGAPGPANAKAAGERNLPWREAFAEQGAPFALEPGKAVYVPVKAPHWVRNGPEVSISFSITWRSEWSFREEYARRMNALLRKAGLRPASPKRYPRQNHLKSLGYRVIDRIAFRKKWGPVLRSESDPEK